MPKCLKEKTANLTGHSPKSLPWKYDENKQSCKNFKMEVKKVFADTIEHGLNIFLTGMAEGFDMIGAEILFELRKKTRYKDNRYIALLRTRDKMELRTTNTLSQNIKGV